VAAIVWADVTAIATELTTVGDSARAMILEYVNGPAMDPDNFDGEAGYTTRMARIYLAAHMGSSIGKGAAGAAGGPVTSESMGGLSRSYSTGSVASSADSTGSTDYGRRYEALVNTSLARLPFTVP
jgi:hypothetical protein